MDDRWIVTPYYFETEEPALTAIAPEGAVMNAPHAMADRSAETLARAHRPIGDFVAETVAADARAVSLAGDCSASLPVLAGTQRAGLAPSLVWVDAHGDFNTPETSPSQFLGGMPLAMIVGRGPQDYARAVGLARLPEDRVWLIDARDLDPLEREAVDASALRRTGMVGLATLSLDAPVHLHIDLDVIDARELPAFNYPVEGGPSVAEAVAALGAFTGSNRVAAVSISGWAGRLDDDGSTARASARIIAAALGR